VHTVPITCNNALSMNFLRGTFIIVWFVNSSESNSVKSKQVITLLRSPQAKMMLKTGATVTASSVKVLAAMAKNKGKDSKPTPEPVP